jgi:hypothetical protein
MDTIAVADYESFFGDPVLGMDNIVEILAAWKGQSIPASDFLRRILSYDGWVVLLNGNDTTETFGRFSLSTAELVRDAQGTTRLWVYSSSDVFEQHQPKMAAAPHVQYIFDALGHEIFGEKLEGMDAVVIDPGSPHECTIDQAQFSEVRELAQAVAIEEVWERLRVGHPDEPDDISRAAQYAGYYLAGIQSEEGVVQISVPHDDGRSFIPIFTHADALALAVAEFRRDFAPAEIKTVRVNGEQAFPALAQEKADGIVFNFKGPGEPIAFALGVIQIVLEELAREKE